MYDSETPDFIGRDEAGRIVGIEIAQLRFSPDERHMRRIDPPEPHDTDARWRLLELMHQKDQKLTSGHWPQCERKVLVIILIDAAIGAITAGTETDRPKEDGFDEVGLPTTHRSRRSAPSTCLLSCIPNSKVDSLPEIMARSPSVEPWSQLRRENGGSGAHPRRAAKL
jgi:hypothetical protein